VYYVGFMTGQFTLFKPLLLRFEKKKKKKSRFFEGSVGKKK
jgi:hypothetical protein